MMRGRGCKPDSHAYGSLLAALAAGSQWQECLRVYSRMLVRAAPAKAAHLLAIHVQQPFLCGSNDGVFLDAIRSEGGGRYMTEVRRGREGLP